MKYNYTLRRMLMIFTDADMSRIQLVVSEDKIYEIVIDVHHLTCLEARRLINNVINILRGTTKITIIHGYTHGLAIKDMIHSDMHNAHIKEIASDPYNMGISYIAVA